MKKMIMLVAILYGGMANAQTTLSLAESKKMALKNNVALKNSQLKVEAMQHVKKNAFTNYFPQVNASVFAMKALDPLVEAEVPGGNLPVYNGNPATLPGATEFAYFPGMSVSAMDQLQVAQVNLIQPLYTGGRIHNGNKLAQLGLDVAIQQQALTEKSVLISTEQQYWQLVSLQEKEKTLAKYEELLVSLEKQVNDAYKAGLILKNDLLKVQLKQSELKSNKNRLLNGKKLATMLFCQTIGMTYDSTLVLAEDLQELEAPQSHFALTDAAVANRIEYDLLQKSVDAEQLQKKMARGENLPQVAVGMSGFYYDGITENFEGTSNGLVFATLSIPISDWWGGSHKVKEHKIKEQIAINNFSDTERSLKLQIEKGWIDLVQAYEMVGLMEATQVQADENLRVTQDSYRQGVVTISDLLEAQALQIETSDKLIEAKAQYKLAITAYLQYTGR
ncbi:TolC family protein [bacterium SCSIO 12741]|nr:TolC family protein [bacterium SCSIO 12741]